MSEESATVLPREASRELLRHADEALDRRQADDPSVREALSLPELRDALHLVVHGLADGRPIRIEVGASVRGSGGEVGDYSPQAVADALGVSRKLVNKLLERGEVRYYTLPGSRHKKIPATEVERLLREQRRTRAGIDQIVDDLVDSGAEY